MSSSRATPAGSWRPTKQQADRKPCWYNMLGESQLVFSHCFSLLSCRCWGEVVERMVYAWEKSTEKELDEDHRQLLKRWVDFISEACVRSWTANISLRFIEQELNQIFIEAADSCIVCDSVLIGAIWCNVSRGSSPHHPCGKKRWFLALKAWGIVRHLPDFMQWLLSTEDSVENGFKFLTSKIVKTMLLLLIFDEFCELIFGYFWCFCWNRVSFDLDGMDREIPQLWKARTEMGRKSGMATNITSNSRDNMYRDKK